MPLLSREDIEKFIRYTEEQLQNERILYEARIFENVKKEEESDSELTEIKPEILSQQWMLINLSSLQSEKSAMQRKL